MPLEFVVQTFDEADIWLLIHRFKSSCMLLKRNMHEQYASYLQGLGSTNTEFAARFLLPSEYICFTSGYNRSHVYYLQDNEQ